MGMDAGTRAYGETGLEPVRTTSPVMGMDAGTRAYGETRTRTGDTTIFSRVLYQLSYLAVAPRG